VSVTWQIDVRREVAFWLDHGVERFALEVTARRTTAPGVFIIERTLNRRALGEPMRATLEEVYRALTSFENIELPYAAPPAMDATHRLALSATVKGGAEARIATPELARTMIEP
jgi:hypothetical protein